MMILSFKEREKTLSRNVQLQLNHKQGNGLQDFTNSWKIQIGPQNVYNSTVDEVSITPTHHVTVTFYL